MGKLVQLCFTVGYKWVTVMAGVKIKLKFGSILLYKIKRFWAKTKAYFDHLLCTDRKKHTSLNHLNQYIHFSSKNLKKKI